MDALESTLDALRDSLQHTSSRSLAAVFAPSFLVHTPEPLLRTRLQYLVDQFGEWEELGIAERLSERSARIRARFAKGYAAEGEVTIDDQQPPQIQWLRFDLPSRIGDSWADIEAAVRALPGRTSFQVTNLRRGITLAAVEPDLVLGVGSVSKLVLLWTLLEEIRRGGRRWQDILHLEARHRSLPTGVMQDWPAEAPLTLHTAAILLISVSDNTAADLLLDVLGRERVEAALDRLALADPARHRPFLSTRALFNLVAGTEERRRAWTAADPAARRALVAQLESEPLADLGPVSGAWPDGFDWLFSAAELSRLLAQLVPLLDGSAEGRQILAINQAGLSLGSWRFSGFKGGSSAGRLAFCVLLQNDAGEWFGVSLVSNATPATLRLEVVAQLIKRAGDQLRV